MEISRSYISHYIEEEEDRIEIVYKERIKDFYISSDLRVYKG
jgi:hypothetical protein